jgi:hypothetical protein
MHLRPHQINGMVFAGLNLVDVYDKHHLQQEMCSEEAMTALNAGIAATRAARWEALQNQAKGTQAPRSVTNGEMMAASQTRLEKAASTYFSTARCQ